MLTMALEKITTNGTGWKYPSASPFTRRIVMRAHEARMPWVELAKSAEAATGTVAEAETHNRTPWLDAGVQLPGCRALGRRFDPRSNPARAPRIAQKVRLGLGGERV